MSVSSNGGWISLVLAALLVVAATPPAANAQAPDLAAGVRAGHQFAAQLIN